MDCLEGKAKELWDSAFSKEFDIGFESGSGKESYSSVIKAPIVKRAASIGASINITIYPLNEK